MKRYVIEKLQGRRWEEWEECRSWGGALRKLRSAEHYQDADCFRAVEITITRGPPVRGTRREPKP